MHYTRITERLAGLGSDKWAVHVRGLEKRAHGETVFMLSIGEPDFSPPSALTEKTIESLRNGRVGYSDGRGEAELLQALADKYAHRTGREIGRDQVIFAPGTQNALFTALLTVAQRDDEVIVPEPFYVTYEGLVAATNASQTPVRTNPENKFHLRADELEAAITDKTTAVIINSPSNPAGAVLSKQEISAIGEICRHHNIWIIADEVYADFTYDGVPFASPFDDPDLADISIVTSSLSKSHAVPGYRAGWIVASSDFCDHALPVAETMLFGSQPFIQDATTFALNTRFNQTETMRSAFENRARMIVETLDPAPGIHCHMPEGGMFIFADIRETGLSGTVFAERLLDETNVTVMPGEAFGEAGAGHIRISLTATHDDLREAIARISRFLQQL